MYSFFLFSDILWLSVRNKEPKERKEAKKPHKLENKKVESLPDWFESEEEKKEEKKKQGYPRRAPTTELVIT